MLTLALLFPAISLAQPEAEYQRVIGEAVAEFDAHRFEEARALFRRAHALSPSARTFRGIGLTSFELRDYPASFRALTAALADTRRPLTEAQRSEVQELLQRTERFIGLYTIVLAPAGATLEVDGRPAVLEADGRLVLVLGTHTLTARLEGHTTQTRSLEVSGGEHEEARFELAPVRAVEAVPGGSEPRAAVEVAGAGRDVTWPGVLIGSGGALAAGALVTALTWWVNRDGEVGRCVMGGASCVNLGVLQGERDAAAGLSLGLAISGVAALGVGLILLALSL